MARLTIHGDADVRAQLQDIGRQAPFALAVALNGTANSVQSAVRAALGDRFTLRRKAFLERTIYRQPGQDFATKASPQAVVRVHPARDVLAKHEEGGTKAPVSGRSVAIPLPGVRRTRHDVISKANRPRALLDRKNVFRDGDTLFQTSGRGKRRKVVALYLFRRSVRLRPRLGMVATAEDVVPQVWEHHALAAIERALATAR